MGSPYNLMFYDYAVTVPAGTSPRNPVAQELKLTAGLIIRLDIEFPAGCRGYVSAVIRRGSHQLYPTNPSGVLNAEDFTVQAWDFYPLLTEPYSVKCYAWSPDANYDHVLTVRIDLVRIEDLARLLPWLSGLEALLQYLGAGPAAALPEEEEVPPTPPTPPTPPAPICTLGAKKCEGFDLYECREVDGVADWVKIEENSIECQYTPPEPPEPPPPPPPPEEPEPSEGIILEVTWVKDGVEHPLSDPIPHNVDFYQRFKIKNTGDHKAEYRVAHYTTGFGEGYKYTKKVILSPTQIAYIDHPYYSSAMPGEYTITWYLFSYDQIVHELTTTHYIAEEEE